MSDVSQAGSGPAQVGSPAPRPNGIRLELHVSHACNLACESCSHFSNHGHKGHVSLAEADQWMGAWSSRIPVREMNLLGGEPTIHPELTKFVPLVRKHWPSAHINLVTNGFFLDRHPDLPRAMRDAGNTLLSLSIHHDAPTYRERLKPVIDLVRSWHQDYGIAVSIRPSFKFWTRRYTGFGADMLPYEDNNPRGAWEICPSKYCRQLFDGKLWKCPPITYLDMQKQKYSLSEKWDPYLAYTPLAPDCTDAELRAFLMREEEFICTMCSAHPRTFELPNPMERPRPQKR